jgi:hypothetical protein
MSKNIEMTVENTAVETETKKRRTRTAAPKLTLGEAFAAFDSKTNSGFMAEYGEQKNRMMVTRIGGEPTIFAPTDDRSGFVPADYSRMRDFLTMVDSSVMKVSIKVL